MEYSAKKFSFGSLDGISEKQLEVHLGLYRGYVKHVNLLTETLNGYLAYGDKASEGDKYATAELRRRLGFEFNGMRMHEHYFAEWEGTPTPIDGVLASALTEQFGSMEAWEKDFKGAAGTRGIGWTMLSYDPAGKKFFNHFVMDHELGQLNATVTILALDMWEHAYMVDFTPAEKGKYIEAFFKNLNGEVVSKRYKE
ncbi:MAG: superoxide dismutase [Patescibacteria group bacterium]|nr:superoxide dismutase [Patescibacteria group bacterium]